MRPSDEVGIVVYGSRGRKLLEHRSVEDRPEIVAAIERLAPEGSTNAEEGLKVAYKMACGRFKPGFINRVILCSDGVANVGRTGPGSILKAIEKDAEAGITLSTVGFGMGNYNDHLMEQLADRGDGNYAYVDTLAEARRVFVQDLTGTLEVVARDAKVQVQFNGDVVRSYRLLGYENRDVADEDFRSDRADGGEIGAGHSVTALYEVKLWPGRAGRIATVRVHYRDPEGARTFEVAREIATADARARFADASPETRLAACAAEFAEIMRASFWARGAKLEPVLELAKECRLAYDHREDVSELVALIEKARTLKADSRATPAEPTPATASAE
jgi:Ca-activated chloride channel family protein